MSQQYNIIVKGKVQGVWYRKSTLEKAVEIGLIGFVKNQPDGSVYIEAKGTKNQLEELIEWCKVGPEYARVDAVTFTKVPAQAFDGFEIL
ncbi:acylphosphatase [Aquimarina aggregata]|uniref:acylphosphatase n=1 Tax=Aquimarina aggregata TaxID=1642818 RepID=A0A162ZQU7_9FLAO|nr:acylphosphatase [Aquimarina aggregata]KZS39965.1 acylphosphatase [Aquimarina aggregata]